MKQFSLEEYLKNPERKVVTRDGRSVRIICTDRVIINDYDYHVIALVERKNGHQDVVIYRDNGMYKNISDSEYDLFFAPQKKEGWLNLYKNEDGRVIIGTVYPIESEKRAKMASEDKNYVATCKIEWEE